MATHDATTWPPRPPLVAPERQQFAAAFNELLRETKQTHLEFAARMFGKDKAGKPNRPQLVRDWCTGDKFPVPRNAETIAKQFKVPLARLLKPKGPLMTDVKKRGPNGATKIPKAPSAPPPLELPKGAEPLSFSMETFKKDPRFATVVIQGLAEIDVAMAILALVHRK
jgi:hypothetical protein